MSPDLLGSLVNDSIFIFVGLYIWLLGTRRIGKPFGVSPDYDAWHDRFRKMFTLGGPLLMMYGVLTFLINLTKGR
jgi:uncharacterized membrane protein